MRKLLLAFLLLIVAPVAAAAMSASSIPTKVPTFWGQSAPSGNITCPIPIPSQIPFASGRASWTDGFPPITFSPVGAGGVPPFGQDFNGVFCQLSQWTRWGNAGGPVFFDQTFATAVGGYPMGAILSNASTNGCYWISTEDNNPNDPDTGGSDWLSSCPGGGSTGTSTGTNAQVVTVNPFVLETGATITFKAGGTNTLALTVNANSTGAINVFRRTQFGASLTLGGEVIAGQMVTLQYDGTEWQCMSCGIDSVGEERVFTGTTVPLGWQIEDGSCLSDTTDSVLFAYYGNSDIWQAQAGGGSCPPAEFHVPFANGRFAYANNAQGAGGGPLSVCSPGITVNCGSQEQGILQSMLPNVNFPVTLTIGGTIGGSQTVSDVFQGGTGTSYGSGGATFSHSNVTINGSNFSFSGAITGGTVNSGGSGANLNIWPLSYAITKAVKR